MVRRPVVQLPPFPVTLALTPVTLPDILSDTVLLTKTPMNIVNVTGGTVLLPLRVYEGYMCSMLVLHGFPAWRFAPAAMRVPPLLRGVFGNVW